MKITLFMLLFAISFVNCNSGIDGTSKVYRNQKYGNYEFGYEITDPFGASNFRREKAIFNKSGSSVIGVYGLADIDGRTRTVKYTADDNGFKAAIDTNEPGMSDIIFYNNDDFKKLPMMKSVAQSNPKKSKNKFKESLRFDASEIDNMNFVKKYTSIMRTKPLIEYKVSATTIKSANNNNRNSRNSRNNRSNYNYHTNRNNHINRNTRNNHNNRNNRNNRYNRNNRNNRKLKLYLKPQYDYYYETEKNY